MIIIALLLPIHLPYPLGNIGGILDKLINKSIELINYHNCFQFPLFENNK